MESRIYPIDYLKSVFIILMIIFHLAYIGDKYPYVKQIVYTFHMPAFLVISGYLANIRKEKEQFIISIIWIFIPYAIMETGYVLMSTILPVREKVENISISLLLNKVFVSPMGPYWYLHTLIIGYSIYFATGKIYSRMNEITFFILLGINFWLLSNWLNLISMANAIYFMLGIIIRQSKQDFLSVFRPSFASIFPLLILCYYPMNLDRFTLAGIVITYLSLSFFLKVYRYLPSKMKNIMHFIGENTLSILLFSPIFTIISKILLPLFTFDPSGLCFICISIVLVISGSLLIAWSMDKINISCWFCGKRNLLNKFLF